MSIDGTMERKAHAQIYLWEVRTMLVPESRTNAIAFQRWRLATGSIPVVAEISKFVLKV